MFRLPTKLGRRTALLFFSATAAATAIGINVVAARADSATPVGQSVASSTLVCAPSTANRSYTLAPPSSARLTGTSVIGTSFSGTLFSQAIVSSGLNQYVAYYNAGQHLTVAHRTLPSGVWSSQTIAGADATVGWDSHDSIALGVDASGQLHVAANMHAHPLRYWRTTTVGNVASLTQIPVMVDRTAESQVTYPQFFSLGNGTLTFNFRQGYSGEGSNYFYSYDTTTHAWTLLNNGPVFDGQGTRSTYDEITRAGGGWSNVTYLWRSPGDAGTNSRLSYVRTRDFTHWQTATGANLTLPLTYATPGVVVDDIPVGGGLSDRHAGIDAAGTLTVTYLKYDAHGSNQLYVARPKPNSTWAATQITHWTGRWSISGANTQAAAVAFSATTALPDGRDALTYWCGATHRTVILSNTTLTPYAEVGYFTGLPKVIWTPSISYPGLSSQQVFTAPAADGTTYVLRWDSLGVNGDLPRTAYPAAQPIVVYTLSTTLAPSVPTGVTAVRNGSGYAVSWTAPAPDAGAPITGYTVFYRSNAGSAWASAGTVSGAYTTLNIGWLNGASGYQFTVSASNAIGSSLTSPAGVVAPMAIRTPPPLLRPGSPTHLSAARSGTVISLKWTPPVVNAASTITAYTVSYSSDAGKSWTAASTLASWYTTMNIGWLDGSLGYQFKVTATNAAGTSHAYGLAFVAPPLLRSGPPTAVTVTKVGAVRTVKWTPPVVNAASTVTSYTVLVSADGGTTWSTAGTLANGYTAIRIGWLNGGLGYQFKVTATNAAGTSSASPTVSG